MGADALWRVPGWRGELTALLAGVLIPLSLAPYSGWPLSLAASAALAITLNGCSGWRSFFRAFLFGIGAYGAGVSWIYVSIHDFGFTGAALATVMTAVFVLFIALLFALPFYLFGRWLNQSRLGFVLGFPAIWVLGEWLRSWLFTGFPWLYAGYAHGDNWLTGWAPVGGVFLLSFFSILSATLICHLASLTGLWGPKPQHLQRRDWTLNALAVAALLMIWVGGVALSHIRWTQAEGPRQRVAIIQPNIPLELKWNSFYHPDIVDALERDASDNWDADIQVWPEAAIPYLFHSAQFFIQDIDTRARAAGTNVFSGVLYDDVQKPEVYNSIIGMGLADGVYFKQKLVPFGEYVPFEAQLRGLIEFFDLPNSVIRVGPYRRDALQASYPDGARYGVAAFICYEVVYPDFVARNSRNASLLLTISNDAWFGDSIGPVQHFDMARFRALETQKPLIRATNTGISAIFDANGDIVEVGGQFQREVIRGTVQARSGLTPYVRFGSMPLLLLCLVIVLGVGLLNRRMTRTPSPSSSEEPPC